MSRAIPTLQGRSRTMDFDDDVVDRGVGSGRSASVIPAASAA